MAFHNIRLFDDTLEREYGSDGGPKIDVNVVKLPSGSEHRVARWNGGLREYNLGYGLREAEDVYKVYKFFLMRGGAEHSFPLKDWLDYATTATGTTHLPGDAAVARTDVQIGVGDGTTTTFQLKVLYTDAVLTRTRNITKPVNGTVLIEVDGVLKTEGADYTINYLTGLVTFTAAPSSSLLIKAGFEFNVEVRFDITSEAMRAVIKSFDTAGYSDIPAIEIPDELPINDALPKRGGDHHAVSAVDVTLTPSDGIFHSFLVTGAGRSVIVEGTLTNWPKGGNYFKFLSLPSSTQSIDIDTDTAVTLATLAAGEACILVIGLDTDGTTKKWFAIKGA